MEASKEPKIERNVVVSVDTPQSEASETNKEKQIEKVVTMEKKVEVRRTFLIYVSVNNRSFTTTRRQLRYLKQRTKENIYKIRNIRDTIILQNGFLFNKINMIYIME